ncbi:LuxR C-terminal-related transcriptional regulator [Vibrio tapetis subsp. quintayensis]|uniref:LuxR C-terminal-related transcriptional regulator n=1 Tax=Vibrio tapetis TaxID=52443 RepID=UPI0025B4FC43|nr:LuxR C-terminal-related transcriptional regulator [Vibrio tapetis]MDN3681031.1 LuxR C-terminal-related transcriptional regulator [Vibrio tapetis subsp. quintayensis]
MNVSVDNEIQAIFIAENNLQSTLLKESIEKEVQLSVKLLCPEKVAEASFLSSTHSPQLIIVDISSCKNHRLDKILRAHPTLHSVNVVLINCPCEVECKDAIRWKYLVGVFNVEDTLENLLNGMEKIRRGELWLSRKLTHQYIHFYRKREQSSTSSGYLELTKREQQIIKLLGSGASNVQIADKLFVSENTVKTHLHNAFKKINVKNRLQALLWVKDNIGSEEFV